MRLDTPMLKASAFSDCLELNTESFEGVECPPDAIFKAAWDTGEVFIVKQDGEIVGFAIVLTAAAPTIWTIAVNRFFRGCGLGTKLLRDITQWCQSMNYAAIELTVRTDNPAQKLYFDMEYRVVRFLPKYYLGDGNGMLMRRVLR